MYTAGYTGEDAFSRDLKVRTPLGDMVTGVTRPAAIASQRRSIRLLNGPGRSQSGGESPEFFGRCGVRPGQPAQHDISRTRIEIALKLLPYRFC
jgi:hypothetical protein